MTEKNKVGSSLFELGTHLRQTEQHLSVVLGGDWSRLDELAQDALQLSQDVTEGIQGFTSASARAVVAAALPSHEDVREAVSRIESHIAGHRSRVAAGHPVAGVGDTPRLDKLLEIVTKLLPLILAFF